MNRRSLSPESLPRYFLLLLLLAAIPACCPAAPIQAIQGEDIPLRGTASGSLSVYLFLTGPNLPSGGIGLGEGSPVISGDPASFTRVEVSTDGTWSYTWRTGSIGRALDPGTYVIYIVDEPRSRPDLDGAAYATQAVIIGGPVGTVTIPLPETTGFLPPGTMQGGPLVTGMQIPGAPGPTPISSPSPSGRLASLSLLPFGAVALALLGLRLRR